MLARQHMEEPGSLDVTIEALPPRRLEAVEDSKLLNLDRLSSMGSGENLVDDAQSKQHRINGLMEAPSPKDPS